MPVLRDHQLEAIFQTALAQLIEQRDLIDWELVYDSLCNTQQLEELAVAQQAAVDVTVARMEHAITDNTRQVQDQHAYQQHFEELETQHQQAVDALTATKAEITRRHRLRTDLDNYRTTLTGLDTAGHFDPATYHVLCQHIQITPDGQATVLFKDGTQINVEG